MNVYELDNTIYDGEIGFDFFLFVLQENPRLLRYGKVLFEGMAKYKLGKLSEEELMAMVETYILSALNEIPDVKDMVCRFWDGHIYKIKDFYYKICCPDDVMITASFSFIVHELLRRLKIQNCICSEINPETGRITLICSRGNKAELFGWQYPDVVPKRYFGDSQKNMPLMELAETSYVVKKNRIVQVVKKEKEDMVCSSQKK